MHRPGDQLGPLRSTAGSDSVMLRSIRIENDFTGEAHSAGLGPIRPADLASQRVRRDGLLNSSVQALFEFFLPHHTIANVIGVAASSERRGLGDNLEVVVVFVRHCARTGGGGGGGEKLKGRG